MNLFGFRRRIKMKRKKRRSWQEKRRMRSLKRALSGMALVVSVILICLLTVQFGLWVGR